MNVLITGTSRGIGLALTREYLQAGHHVYASCRRPDTAEQLQNLAADNNDQVSIMRMDVTDEESIQACVEQLGGKPLDVLINNAGIFGGNHQSFADIDVAEWLQTFKINTIGPMLVTQAFHQNLKAARGKVMTISSLMGTSAWPQGDNYAYASSKAGINRVAQGLAVDLRADGIAVGVIHPGWVKTDMGSESAHLTPQESAASIRRVINILSLRNSGSLWKWNGKKLDP